MFGRKAASALGYGVWTRENSMHPFPSFFSNLLSPSSVADGLGVCAAAAVQTHCFHQTAIQMPPSMQDCWVGLLFALLPLFKPHSVHHPVANARLGASSAHAGAHALALAETGVERTAQAVIAIVKVRAFGSCVAYVKYTYA